MQDDPTVTQLLAVSWLKTDDHDRFIAFVERLEKWGTVPPTIGTEFPPQTA